MHKYVYRFAHWGKDEWSEWETDDGYHTAAERICEDYDAQVSNYPDERVLFLRDVTHDTPRCFAVYTETQRVYDAFEKEN